MTLDTLQSGTHRALGFLILNQKSWRGCPEDHEHQRRDGRPCLPTECHAWHRADLAGQS